MNDLGCDTASLAAAQVLLTRVTTAPAAMGEMGATHTRLVSGTTVGEVGGG